MKVAREFSHFFRCIVPCTLRSVRIESRSSTREFQQDGEPRPTNQRNGTSESGDAGRTSNVQYNIVWQGGVPRVPVNSPLHFETLRNIFVIDTVQLFVPTHLQQQQPQQKTISTNITMNQSVLLEVNMLPSQQVAVCGGKRTRAELVGELEKAAKAPRRTRRKLRRRHVSWAKNTVHVLVDNHQLFKEYKDEDIWYTRRENEEFLMDRIQTIGHLRNLGGNENVSEDRDCHCARGLEPFQTQYSLEQFKCNRAFHRTTVLIEQVRQSLNGLRSPERFRTMVGLQSEIAARRARELASMDEHDVYGRGCRRESFVSPLLLSPFKWHSSVLQVASKEDGENNTTSDFSCSMTSLEQQIQQLQESNARHLMEIYSQPGCYPFRFPVRRDSLIGSTSRLELAYNVSSLSHQKG